MEPNDQNKLLYGRAGFGISLKDYAQPLQKKEAVESLFPKSAPKPLYVITLDDWMYYNPGTLKGLDDMEKRDRQQNLRKRMPELNLLWLSEMVQTQNPFLEKMSLFWHGHFACRIDNPYYDQLLLDNIRTNALGSFSDLLRAVSKSPAMLSFLNNQQNKKQHPNENFAREVMELFTLGRGHYTEDDVKEAARAFTGWGFDGNGNYIFRKGQHDTDSKKFLGKKGNFDGDQILDILLEQKQTAIFITQKIYRFFVNDDKIDQGHVKELARHFYESYYDISALMKKMFSSDWFYDERTVGAKIKSPVELLVGYMRMLPMKFQNEKVPLQLQRVLGQALFYPPNVAGWPGGRSWIDSSSLVIRMRLPEAMLASKELDLHLKEVDPEMTGGAENMKMTSTMPAQQFKMGQVTADWTEYLNFWQQTPKDKLAESLAAYLLPVSLPAEKLSTIKKYADNDSTEEYIKSLTILLMELPEYQLC